VIGRGELLGVIVVDTIVSAAAHRRRACAVGARCRAIRVAVAEVAVVADRVALAGGVTFVDAARAAAGAACRRGGATRATGAPSPSVSLHASRAFSPDVGRAACIRRGRVVGCGAIVATTGGCDRCQEGDEEKRRTRRAPDKGPATRPGPVTTRARAVRAPGARRAPRPAGGRSLDRAASGRLTCFGSVLHGTLKAAPLPPGRRTRLQSAEGHMAGVS